MVSMFELRMRRIRQWQQRELFDLALSHCRELMDDFPTEGAVSNLYHQLLDQVHTQRDLDFDQRHAEMRKEMDSQLHRMMIPTGIDGRPEWPETWWDVQLKRQVNLEQEEIRELWRDDIANRLNQIIDIKFDGEDVLTALRILADISELPIVTDPALTDQLSMPVTLSLRQIQASTLLNWLTLQSDTKWRIQNEAIWVGGNKEDEFVLRSYDVATLLFRAPDFPGVTLGASQASTDGGLTSLNFGDDREESEQIFAEDFIDMMQQAIAPGVWEDGQHVVRLRGDTMVVNALPETHALISEFIQSQLAANNDLVQMKVRWMELTDTFFEEIGVDWNNDGRQLYDTPGTNYEGLWTVDQEWTFTGRTQGVLPESESLTPPQFSVSGLSLQQVLYDHLNMTARCCSATPKNERAGGWPTRYLEWRASQYVHGPGYLLHRKLRDDRKWSRKLP